MKTNTNMNFITAMILNKYRENETTTVLKARAYINEYTLNPTYENLESLLMYCMKRRDAYNKMQKFYNNHKAWNKSQNAWNRWVAYSNLIDMLFNYIDVYAFKKGDDAIYQSLTYLIIKNKLGKI